MARLPSVADLSRVLYRPSTPNIRVPEADYSALAQGAQNAERGIRSGITAVAAIGEDVDDYETRKKLIDFQVETELDLEDRRRSMPAGGTGFSTTFQKDYDKRAKQLFKTIPQSQRDKVDLALVQQGATLTERASKYEMSEADRSTKDGLVQTLETLSRVVEGNPDRKDLELSKGQSLIDLAKLEPETKAKLKKAYGEQVDAVAARTKIKGATTAAQFKAIADELQAKTPGADLTSVLTSGKSKGRATGWTAKDPTWAKLSPFQKAAAMSLMEADRMDPVSAKNALGAMINRAAKTGEDLGAHVSQKIYQPTIEPAQQARLGRILNSPQFQQLTTWAEARAQGLEPDPVNGATHFLASEATMLALEKSDPGKYKNWGPRGANWTGFDETKGEYKGVITRDKSHAFLAPEGAYGGAGPAYDGPYKNLSFEQRDKLFEEAKSQRKEVGRLLLEEIKGAETVAVAGKLPPGFEGLMQKVEEFGDPEISSRLKTAGTKAQITFELRTARPQEAMARVDQARRSLGDTATPQQVELFDHMAKVADTVQTEVRKDQLAWSKEALSVPLQQLDFNAPDIGQRLKTRAQEAFKVSQYYGVPPRLFTNAERDALADSVKAGGQVLIGTVDKMAEHWGPAVTTQAVREISDKIPEAAVAGYLLANKINQKAAVDISMTLQRRQDPNYRPSVMSRSESEGLAKTALGDVYRNFPPQQRDAILGAADAVFEARIANKPDDPPGVYKQALADVIGQRTDRAGKVYGGVVSAEKGTLFFKGQNQKFVLPPTYKQETWRNTLEAVSVGDLMAARHPMPTDAMGKPLSMTRIANATLVQDGNGTYRVALGKADEPGNEQWASTVVESPTGPVRMPFVLDLNRLEPVLRKRFPTSFWNE